MSKFVKKDSGIRYYTANNTKKLKLDNIYLPKRKIESFIVSIERDWGRLRTIEVKKHSKIVQV